MTKLLFAIVGITLHVVYQAPYVFVKNTIFPTSTSAADPLFSGFLPRKAHRKARSLGPSFIFHTEMENHSPASAHSQAQRIASNAAEDRINHENNDEYWSDDDGADEEGPKRKRARPLSAYLSIVPKMPAGIPPIPNFRTTEYVDV